MLERSTASSELLLRVLAKGGCSAHELNPVIENLLAGLLE